jgi:hypothetical protein
VVNCIRNIKWSTKPVKALGVFHGYAIDLEMIWLEKINEIKSCMEVWKSRDLTYFGKINWVSSANMFTFVSISGPFLFGKDMPTILGLRLMDVANGSACKMYSMVNKTG